MTCPCCLSEKLDLQKTDDPEVKRCSGCGLPYWVDDHGVVVSPAVSPSWVRFGHWFWFTHKSLVFPADYQILKINSEGVSLRDCTAEQQRLWNTEIL